MLSVQFVLLIQNSNRSHSEAADSNVPRATLHTRSTWAAALQRFSQNVANFLFAFFVAAAAAVAVVSVAVVAVHFIQVRQVRLRSLP